jgi:nitrite reductase (NADH) large subunit
MKVIIIGAGVAGQTAAEYIRKGQPNAEILMISKEPYTYYSRIFLPHYISNERPLEKVIMRDEDWYNKNNISLLLDTEAIKIDAAKHEVHVKNEEGSPEAFPYDKLLIATGSNARKLPFGNPNVEGMFTLRKIADANEIKQYIADRKVKDVLVIGGGLLGIELAYHLRELQLNITICEIAPYLLPRQLDQETSKLLTKYLESKGLKIICGASVKQVVGNPAVTGVELDNGKTIPVQLVMQQMGIIPELEVAKNSNIPTDKGIIVNEFMQTNDPDIYSSGDCVQFKNLIWGIIPASMEQAKIAAMNMLGQKPAAYEGTFWNTRLKIAGLKLSCFGSPPDSKNGEETVVEDTDEENYLCKKIVIEQNKIKGAILMGSGDDNYFMKNIGKPVDLDEVRKKIKEKGK